MHREVTGASQGKTNQHKVTPYRVLGEAFDFMRKIKKSVH